MVLKVRLYHRARSDLIEIRNYLMREAGSVAAERVRSHLQQKLLMLGTQPLMGTPTTNPNIRILSPTRYPYRIYFTVTPSTVYILHVRHTSRQDVDPDELI